MRRSLCDFRTRPVSAAPRLALVGDAAHSVHPLAGQGLNIGLADARALARAVAEGNAAGIDIGALEGWAPLQKYEEERWLPALAMGLGIDGLEAALSGESNDALPAMRGVVLQLLNGPLKSSVLRRLARLARGD